MPDPRIVYGASCCWWDSITKVALLPSGLPCCPVCHGVLYEVPSEKVWWTRIEQHDAKEPGYRSFIEWLRGQHFTSLEEAKERFRNRVVWKYGPLDGCSEYIETPTQIWVGPDPSEPMAKAIVYGLYTNGHGGKEYRFEPDLTVKANEIREVGE